MAYIPDEWVINRASIAPSARDILFYYCARADKETGKTNVSPERTSQDLGIRKDHVDEHDRKLTRMGLISITKDENGGRIVTLNAPWQPRSKRGQKTEKTTTSQDLGKTPQVLGNDLKDFPSLGEIPQVLGKSPQVLGGHIRNNQLMNHAIEPDSAGAGAETPPATESPPPLDANRTVWQLGVGLLKSVGEPEEHARSFLGKMAKDYGKERLAQAIVSAMAAEPISPKEYLVKVLQGAANGKGSYEQERKRRAEGVLDLFDANRARRRDKQSER